MANTVEDQELFGGSEDKGLIDFIERLEWNAQSISVRDSGDTLCPAMLDLLHHQLIPEPKVIDQPIQYQGLENLVCPRTPNAPMISLMPWTDINSELQGCLSFTSTE